MSKDDLFKEAAKEAAKQALNLNIEPKKEELTTVEQKALDLTEQNTTSAWARLKDKVNGAYADKAMDIIDTLPDREFIKVYLKLLEYVNPKITRKEIIGNNDNDNEIKVLIVQNQNEPQEKVIDVTHTSQEETSS